MLSSRVRHALRIALLTCATTGMARAQIAPSIKTYEVDCNPALSHETSGSSEHLGQRVLLHSLAEVNALQLGAHDRVLFRRGTVCRGSLHPRGSGFTISATGVGPLPRVEAEPQDEAAMRLFNQDDLDVSSLELQGGTTYGLFISGDRGTLRGIALHNLTVHGVRGALKHKESGLVVIRPSAPGSTFADLRLDSIRAFDTTQWAGIFVAGGAIDHPAQSVHVSNSVVHDVQGDGIVIFNARNSEIRHSLAWHTGMQHIQTIGTPNAIWTWQCTDCLVADNEAFLTDSPGVDGGAFDIDWGNTRNTVQHNFGHDTQGYCISVFAANGPTTQSVVDANLCLNNGVSPRLAQRQGAILLMTWNGGLIDGLILSNNRLDWSPAGDTPAIRSGAHLDAKDVLLTGNDVHTTSAAVIDPAIPYNGQENSYTFEEAAPNEPHLGRQKLAAAREENTTVLVKRKADEAPRVSARGWRLRITLPASTSEFDSRPTRLLLHALTAQAEYAGAGLRLSIAADPAGSQQATDWGFAREAATIQSLRPVAAKDARIQLVAPNGHIVKEWPDSVSPIAFGLGLRRYLGPPRYSKLPFEEVRATD